jgi:hypothetical protein
MFKRGDSVHFSHAFQDSIVIALGECLSGIDPAPGLDALRSPRTIRATMGRALAKFALRQAAICGGALMLGTVALADDFSAGPLFDQFRLTLEPGTRLEAAGPLYYEQEAESHIWGMPPFWSHTVDPGVPLAETDVLYPIFTMDRFGEEYRYQFLQVFAFAGGQSQEGNAARRFTLFPFYFQQRSPRDPSRDYTAFLPFYGHLRNRLFRDEIDFVLFPIWVRTRKKDVITHNYVAPFFHLREGTRLSGWQFWPIVGNETKEPGSRTNSQDEVEIDPGHKKFFALWPFFFRNRLDIGTTNEQRVNIFLPLYSLTRSPARDSSTYFWPFGLTITEDRAKGYGEWGFPWPIIDFAHGTKTTRRVWPLFSQSHNATTRSDFYLWPVYKYNRFTSSPLDRDRTRILFFLYSDINERNTLTGEAKRRTDLWPLFTAKRDFNGKERFQILAPLEPLLPNNKGVERNYSPLWSLWRSEKDPKSGRASQSVLWNLYRRDIAPDSKQVSFFFGLFQYRGEGAHISWRVFYVPIGKRQSEGASK